MDLTNLWQEHRVFITSVVGGLLVFLIGQAVIANIYAIDEKNRAVARFERDLRILKTPAPSKLEEAHQTNAAIKSQYRTAVERVAFVPEPRYLLSAEEKPDIQYDRLFNEARDTLVEFAKTLNITVDPSLGMPELSPTRRNEIQRALTALDIVTRVVLLAIESQVSLIESISMVPDAGRKRKHFVKEQQVRFKMQGAVPTLAEFLRRFVSQDRYLAIDEAGFRMGDKAGATVTMDITVSALVIIKEEPES